MKMQNQSHFFVGRPTEADARVGEFFDAPFQDMFGWGF
jgi:hypothetical protein